jgi:hypothetical protein
MIGTKPHSSYFLVDVYCLKRNAQCAMCLTRFLTVEDQAMGPGKVSSTSSSLAGNEVQVQVHKRTNKRSNDLKGRVGPEKV